MSKLFYLFAVGFNSAFSFCIFVKRYFYNLANIYLLKSTIETLEKVRNMFNVNMNDTRT